MSYDTINVAVAFCDPRGTYARHAAVTIASVCANTAAPLCVYVLHDETLTLENCNKIIAIGNKFGKQIRMLNVSSLIDRRNDGIQFLTREGLFGKLFRLLTPILIKADKIIYFDCDVIVNTDIDELWNIPIDNYSVAAVKDGTTLSCLEGSHRLPLRSKLWLRVIDVPEDLYFNSGVLVMNLKKIRNQYDLLAEARRYFSRYRKCITYVDQDFLNKLFCRDCIFLPEKFNDMRSSGHSARAVERSIWHLSGEIKPWILYSRPDVDELYWYYLSMTPYCPDEMTLIKTMLSDLSFNEYTHRHSINCLKRLKKQIYDNVIHRHTRTVPYILLAALRDTVVKIGSEGRKNENN